VQFFVDVGWYSTYSRLFVRYGWTGGSTCCTYTVSSLAYSLAAGALLPPLVLGPVLGAASHLVGGGGCVLVSVALVVAGS
jgi:hypothetical protein